MFYYALSLTGGLMLAFSFPRFDWNFLAWIGLIPLFYAILHQTPKRAAIHGLVFGLAFYMVSLSWITNTLINYGNIPTAIAWLIMFVLALYCSAYLVLFCYLLKKLSGHNLLLFVGLAPVLWTTLEYIRSTHLEYGFSWQGLGYSQWSNLTVLQLAEITGVYGVSALIVMVNAGLFYCSHPGIRMTDPWRQWRKHVGAVMFTVFAICLAFGWSALTSYQEQPVKPLKVGLVQGNIPQQMKWDPQYKADILKTYFDLTLKASASNPDLVVWPEAVTPFYFLHDLEGTAEVIGLTDAIGIPLVFGSPHLEYSGKEPVSYNSAYYLSDKGNIEGRYDKIHMVPCGEFVPFQPHLSVLDKMVVGIGNFGRGKESPVFTLGDYKFAISICYEMGYPDELRRPVKNGAQFLVNVTNDAWFGKSAASYQHFSMAAFRAVENRVPIVRAANTGISGAVDAIGRIHPASGIFVKEVIVTGVQPRSGGTTFYTEYGDVFCWLCMVLSVGLGFYGIRQGKTNRKPAVVIPEPGSTEE